VDGADKAEWKRIIGMRNALVHGYLNIEPEIIKTIIRKETYNALLDFSKSGLNALQEE